MHNVELNKAILEIVDGNIMTLQELLPIVTARGFKGTNRVLQARIGRLRENGYLENIRKGLFRRTAKQYEPRKKTAPIDIPEISWCNIPPFSTPHKTAGLGWELHKE